MTRKRIEMILEIHQACTLPLYLVLENIPEDQFRWRPAPESRSISEIMCHMIRVDNSYLKRLNQKQSNMTPVTGSLAEVLEMLKGVHGQIRSVIDNCSDDSELFTISTLNDAKPEDTINEHILHSCQHNLYHLAQMIYLRRALDRSWDSPINEWDKATRIIANYLSPEFNKKTDEQEPLNLV